MNRHFASNLAFLAASAAACAAAILWGNAYADDITIDPTPFVSTRTRAEVKVQTRDQRRTLFAGATEWAMQKDSLARAGTGYTRQQARAAYRASREEVRTMTSEDSGSSYLARR